MSALVEIKDVCKVYNPGENEVRALDHVSLTIDERNLWPSSDIPEAVSPR